MGRRLYGDCEGTTDGIKQTESDIEVGKNGDSSTGIMSEACQTRIRRHSVNVSASRPEIKISLNKCSDFLEVMGFQSPNVSKIH